MKEKQTTDRFIQIAAGGKKMTGEVKRLEEIPPLEVKHREIPATEREEIKYPHHTEEENYALFLAEKAALRKKYEPFLRNMSRRVQEVKRVKRLKDFSFRKETEQDKSDFVSVLAGKGEWEEIKLPHYVGPDGKWNAFYRTILELDEKEKSKHYFIEFEAVDYIAEVYLNGRLVARHTGFFAPFSADITDCVKKGENVLVVVVKNDYTTTAGSIDGTNNYGDKIYGATHLGYDEPNYGWHHCPAGAGIFGKVELVVCNDSRITDIFVRPDIDNSKITVDTTVYNYLIQKQICLVKYRIEGRNFLSNAIESDEIICSPFQNGSNYIKQEFELKDFRLWTPDEPYLYEITVTLLSESGEVLDERQTHFGMRKFVMDENSTPKGAFYLNNERIMLRGTNEMGHLPRCVMEGNYEQLIDDILIAKVANLNFYRTTQRPVFDEIYTYFDMLGMLCQTDFPLFSYLKYSALSDAVKQVDEMERLTRNHPSVVLETFCNETLDKTAWGKEQYVMSRFEIEKFFEAARQITEINNPDRVLKYNEGDYAPLTQTHGISDFHCYTYWYVSHGMPSGKLAKGYLPPIRKDWMTGCGEFGVDGLDRAELMRKYCPKDWLPETDDEPWSPVKIAKEQCYVLHGDFFPEQDNLREWIAASRNWQKEAIKKYVHILRYRSDYIESTAVHLLIDAWPCGWTKTLVDVDRVPKPAFYAFKEANIPVRVSLRRDMYTVYAGEKLITEVYAYNDTPRDAEAEIKASVYFSGELSSTHKISVAAKGVSTAYCGDVAVQVPKDFVGNVRVVTEMISDGNSTFDEVEYRVMPRIAKAKCAPIICGERLKDVKRLCGDGISEKVVFTDGDYYASHREELEEKAKSGARIVAFIDKPLCVLGEDISFRVHTIAEEVRANNFVARSESSEFTKEFGETDFMNFYNAEKDHADLTAWFKFDWSGSEEILYTFDYDNDQRHAVHKKHKMIAACKTHGKGEIILSTLSALSGCIGHNPVLDKFLINLIEKDR